jgi:hypothetical protein
MAKFKINKKILESTIAKKIAEVKGALQGRKLLDDVGEQIIKDIKRNTRTGKGFSTSQLNGIKNNKRESLPSLEKSTIKARKYYAKFNPTTQVYKSGRSNLSFSGQLIDSIAYDVKKGRVVVSASGKKRRAYRTLKGKVKNTPSNDEIIGYLEKKGFYFLGIDDKTIDKIKTIAKRQIRRLLRS